MSDAPLPVGEDLPEPPSGMIDDALARYNSTVLSLAQALYSVSSINMFATAALVGVLLARTPRWATLPVTAFVIGTAIFTYPAAQFMQRRGRRPGFLLGAAVGLIGAGLAVWALYRRDFALFCFATFLQGVYQAFAQYYRFAAADTASLAFRPKAVAWVLAGSIAGAVLGPILIMNTRELFAPVSFAGNFAASGVLTLMALGVLAFVKDPPPAGAGAEETREPPRPLPELLRQPRLLIAIFTGMIIYGVMNMLMTATPLAMVGCGLSVDQSSWVIQWHALAMYVPSFFTGALIARFGLERIIALGLGLTALSALIHVLGFRVENFGFGMVMDGLGWNFGFIGATTMVTECHRASERSRVQGLNDMAIFITTAVTSYAAGALLDIMGWRAVNYALLPLLAVSSLALAWMVLRSSRGEPR